MDGRELACAMLISCAHPIKIRKNARERVSRENTSARRHENAHNKKQAEGENIRLRGNQMRTKESSRKESRHRRTDKVLSHWHEKFHRV